MLDKIKPTSRKTGDNRKVPDSAMSIVAQVQAGQSAVGYAEQALICLGEIERFNACIHVDNSLTLRWAESVDQRLRAGQQLPLAGVPFIIKDNLSTRDMPTSGGVLAYRDFLPARNATTVQQMLDAGAVPVGKANLHELAFGITSANAGFGCVLNPYDSSRVAGGSSGGTAVAVSAGIPLGLGTDTGGSIRIPASFCGVYGFRSTLRRYSTQGVLTISPTRDVVGTMANCLDDLLLLDEVLTWSGERAMAPELSTLRIGIPGAPYFDDLEPGIALCVERVLARLQESGATLVALDACELHRLDVRAGFCVSAFEARTQWWRYCESQLKVSVEAFIASIESADVRAVFEFFASREMFQAQDYADALHDVQAMVRWYDEVFHTQQIDCLLMPSVACEALTVFESRHSMPFDESTALFAKVARQVSPAALAGIPSISIPMGFSGVTGLPVGLICEGPAGSDRRLLAIAKRIDSLLQ